MKKKKKRIDFPVDYFLMIVFCVFVFYFFLMNEKHQIDNNEDKLKVFREVGSIMSSDNKIIDKSFEMKKAIAESESIYNESFNNRMNFVENFGLMQHLIGSHIVDDVQTERRVFKGSDSMLYYVIPEKIDGADISESLNKLKVNLDQRDIGFSVIFPPNKHLDGSDAFPSGVVDHSVDNSKQLSSALSSNNIDTLDLGKVFADEKMDARENFFLTDTHWNMNNVFYSYGKILEHLKNKGIKLSNTNETTDIENYIIERYENTYIGSMGKRTGEKYLDKKDDIELYIPKYPSDYNYIKYNNDGSIFSDKSGNFEKSFIFRDAIYSKDPYEEKYISMMNWGTYEEHIVNKMTESDTKILIIRDSFVMPISAFLAQNVKEITMLDLRSAQSGFDLISFIDELKPDYVIFMASTNTAYYYPEIFYVDKFIN